METPELKRCGRCKVVKSASEFSRNRARADGLETYCKHCASEWLHEYRCKRKAGPRSGEKECSKCHRVLEVAEFPLFKSQCRDCAAEKRRVRYAERSRLASVDEGTKECRVCHGALDTTQFRRDPSCGDMLSSVCKQCEKKYRAEYHSENRERENSANRARRTENIEQYRQRAKVSYWKHRDKIAARASQRHREHPEFSRRAAAKRRAVMRSNPTGTPEELAAFYHNLQCAPRMKCHWCGRIAPRDERHADHIIPISKGGAHAVYNLCCSCSFCNRSKGAKLPHEFAGQAAFAF